MTADTVTLAAVMRVPCCVFISTHVVDPLQSRIADSFVRECFLYCPDVPLKVGHARLNFLKLADALL